jgi:hypothetical protein
VTGGTVSAKLNDKVGPYFVSHKGVRQGDPLSPILFNFVSDYLARMVRKTQQDNMIIGPAYNLIPKGVAILQYADDTIICLKDELEIARDMKLLLYLYKLMSGLKINFFKSEVILINGDDGKNLLLENLFNCQIEEFPIKYLGVPVSPCRLHVKDWSPWIEKNGKKLAVWKGNTMSIAGRTVLINSTLTGSFICHISIYMFLKLSLRVWTNKEELFFGKEGGRKENTI